MNLYVYSVRYYQGENRKWMTSSGVVCGKNQSDATAVLQNFFCGGKEGNEIEVVSIYSVDCGDCGVVDFQTLFYFAHDHELLEDEIDLTNFI